MKKCSNMPIIEVPKNMDEITYAELEVIKNNLNEIIRQRANPVDDTMDYLKQLLGNRYSPAEWNIIRDKINEIIRQRANPADKVINYVVKGLLKGNIYIDELYL